jgi:hypothetical protein
LIRKKIAETPIEILQKRNNVEATVFQLVYHYPNAKSKYGGLVKHQMWANIRCLWVNFIRILKYIKQLRLKTTFFAKYLTKSLFNEFLVTLKLLLTVIFPTRIFCLKNITFKGTLEKGGSQSRLNFSFINLKN